MVLSMSFLVGCSREEGAGNIDKQVEFSNQIIETVTEKVIENGEVSSEISTSIPPISIFTMLPSI